MSSEEVPLLLHLCSGADARLDVLFVHGLTGTPKETWTNADGAFWPKWLCADLPGVSVYTLGYPASMFGKWAKKEMDLHERAASMLEHLAAHGIGKRPIALVCHSLGGILAKEMLRTSAECNDSSWQQIAEKTRFAAFLGTPHTGASLAAAIKFAVPPGFFHPRFALFDNIEDKGMEMARSHNFQEIIVRMSEAATLSHQIIVTTSMPNPSLNQEALVVGPHYTHDVRTLDLSGKASN